jgi:putative molybdopterin biosynthesis protein
MERIKKRRGVYLEDIPLEEALKRFFTTLEEVGSLAPMPPERIPIEQGLGRVTAQPVWAKISSPHYHAAAMDGIAVRAEQTYGASETSPLQLRIGEQAQWIDTGEPLPQSYNAVITIEHVQEVDEGIVEIMSPAIPWQQVRLIGEDIVATELVLPENHLLRAVDLGAIAACGLPYLEVRRKPRIAIIPTGSELVPPGETLKPGDIIEFDSLMLAELVKEWGGVATRFPSLPDECERIKIGIQGAIAECDVVVVTAGSSAGRHDYVAQVLAELGQVLVHGIAIRPGHPVILGIVENKPTVGIPGYPVSAVLTFDLLVKPLIHHLLGTAPLKRPRLGAVMSHKVFSSIGEDEFLRVKVGKVGDKVVATPLQRGAGIIMSLVRADGLVLIPRFSEGIHAGEKVEVELLRPSEEIENTIVAIGSHDLALDLLANHLHKLHPQICLSSSNVGSLGGLLALKRGEAHLAGSHLLDEESGEYNVPYIKRLLPDHRIVVVNLVYRAQGLILVKGNPKGISTLQDLSRDDVSFINRQRGAGTRVLLDFKLKELGINPQRIKGYEQVGYTHLAVAAVVASGVADVGLGIMAAAKALNLDFVPLLWERYDLVIPQPYYESPLLKPLLDILHQPSFRAEVEALGGYDTAQMGQIVAWPLTA